MLLATAVAATCCHPRMLRVLRCAWRRVRWDREPKRADSEAVFLGAVRAELRAGASVRQAVVAAAARVPELSLGPAVRLARAGLPLGEVGRAAAAALPVNGAHAAAALEMTALTGARAAALFGRLAERAADVQTLARERRALTAQARFSATIVAGLPVLVAVFVIASGGASATAAAGPLGALVLGVGVALELAGLGVIVWLLRRSGT